MEKKFLPSQQRERVAFKEKAACVSEGERESKRVRELFFPSRGTMREKRNGELVAGGVLLLAT